MKQFKLILLALCSPLLIFSQNNCIEHAKSCGFNTDNIYAYTDSIKQKELTPGLFPHTIIYNNKGFPVNMLACISTTYKDLTKFIETESVMDLDTSSSVYRIIGKDTFQVKTPALNKIKNSIFNVNGSKSLKWEEYDYIIICNYTDEYGDVYKEYIAKIENYCKEIKKVNIALLKICCL